MKIQFVYKILPAFIFNLSDESMDGKTLFNLVFIKDDAPMEVLIHELVHVKQFYRTFGLFSLLYRFSSSKRFMYECEAYKAMIDYRCLTEEKHLSIIEEYAKLLHTQYNLKSLNLKFNDTLATLIYFNRK